jgi:DNA-binding NtrC family response regulator
MGADGREMEFVVRSLVELKLQIEQLRSRVNSLGEISGEQGERSIGGSDQRVIASKSIGTHALVDSQSASVSALEPPGRGPVPVTLTIQPGMTMAEIEKAAITAALAETKGNRRKAAELLGIGERTMYRKLRDYGIPTR